MRQRIEKDGQQEWGGESGQAAISLVLLLGMFLLGTLGFAVDLTNTWFHRQNAQTATDAACEAGAMDMVYAAAGEALSTANFTAGTASDCVSSPSATMCTYAAKNGYNGTGLVANTASNSVSWTFPSTVTGVTAGGGTNSFLKVTVSENVPTYFMRMVSTKKVLNINTTATCGVAGVRGVAPVLVLNPTASGSFTYTGGGALYIVGGPTRGVQVNSNSSTAVKWTASGILNTSKGGPNSTGSDLGIVGGPTTIPTNGSSSGFTGGTTGNWKAGIAPIPDPFGSVNPPTSMKSITPSNGWVAYGVDGCPDHRALTGTTGQNCYEYNPGYYSTGIPTVGNGYSTVIFKPGVYYLNGSLSAGGSTTMRVAKVGVTGTQTNGVMFYFLSGSLQISGGSGGSGQCTTFTGCTQVDPENSTDLTCDGSSPNSSLGMGSTITGNILYGQCTTNGTYYDGSSADSTDTLSSTGSRGLLIFQAHTNTSAPSLSGSGSLAFSGSLYMHSSSYGTIFSLSGGASTGTYMLGEIVTDEINLSGSGIIRLALNPSFNVLLGKVGEFQ